MRLASGLLLAILSALPHAEPKPSKTATVQSPPDKRGSEDSPLVVTIKSTTASENKTAEAKKKTDEEAAIKIRELRLTAIIALAACVQAGFAFFQWRVYVKQSKIMNDTLSAVKRQGDIMDVSVAVAKQSAETTAASFAAVINKERARISMQLLEFEFGEIPTIKFAVTCHGTTPAYIASTWEMADLIQIPDFPWSKEAYGTQLKDFPSVLPNGTWQGEAFIMGTDLKATNTVVIQEALKKGELFLHFRARIVYKDIFDESNEHTFSINKVYGIRTMSTLGDDGIMNILNLLNEQYPEWHDSLYDYGEEDWKENKIGKN